MDGSACPSDICTELSDANTYIFNVTHFTNYSVGEGGCGTLTSSATMTSHLNASGTCFTIGANNVNLNCAGYTITYGIGGIAEERGVDNIGGYDNVTVRNCVIIEGNATGDSKHGIHYFNNANNGTIQNNTVTTSSNLTANILMEDSDYTLIRDNFVNGTGNDGTGIGFISGGGDGSDYNVADNNVIHYSGTSDLGALDVSGVAQNNTLVNNNITAENALEITEADVSIDSSNYLIYNNSFGEIRWTNRTFLDNLTLDIAGGIGLGINLFIGNNTIAFNTSAVNKSHSLLINSSANLTLRGLDLSSVAQIKRVENFTTVAADIQNAGTNCNGTSCQIISYSGGTLRFNTSYFSSFAAQSVNERPTAPVTLSPANGSSITNRTPAFIWANSTDTEGDIFSYHLQVDNNKLFNNPEINVSAIAPDAGKPNTTFYPVTVLDVDTTYYWRVRANDSGGFGTWSNGEILNLSNFTIDSLLQITFTTDLVEFGEQSGGAILNTTDGVPRPFRAENTGNIFFNVSVNASQLFTSVGLNRSEYQYQFRENESGSFNTTLSTIVWRNMSKNLHGITDAAEVNWRDVNDDFLMDLNLTVPDNEPPGGKSSIITFTVTGSGIS